MKIFFPLTILFISLMAEAFETDRPTKTRTPFVAGVDNVILESEFANYGLNDEERLYTNKLFQFLIRYGLSEKSELVFSSLPYLNERTKSGREWKEKTGISNSLLGYKYSLQNESLAIGLLPYLILPTSSADLGSQRVAYGFSMPVAFKLPGKWGGNAMLEINNERQEENLNWQANYITTLSINHPLTKSLLGYVEIFNEKRGNELSNITTLDLALQYEVTNNVKLDAGTFIGLSPAANDEEYFIGGSFLF
ncbi:MAG: transporter [Bacteriovoracia bacterium]